MTTGLTAQDVVKVAPQIGLLSGTTKPSADYVDTICIPDAEREVDFELHGVGYKTEDFSSWEAPAQAFVVELVRWRAAVTVLLARGLAAGNPDDQGVSRAQQEYARRLKAVTDPKDPTEILGAIRTDQRLQKDPEDFVASFADTAPAEDLAAWVTRETVF